MIACAATADQVKHRSALAVTRTGVAMLSLATLLGWSRLDAQSVRHACLEVDRDARIVRDPHRFHEPAENLRDTLVVLLGRSPTGSDGVAALNRLWRHDSAGMAWALAGMIAQSDQVTDEAAENAATEYRRHGGPSYLVVGWMDVMGDQRWRRFGLDAINSLSDSVEEEIVFRWACDAAWLLNAVNSDSAYASAGGYDHRDLTSFYRLRSLLDEATRLIRHRHRADMSELMSLAAKFRRP